MGSHGGATAEGQLADAGQARHDRRTSLDAEIRSSMETVVVAHDASGRPLHLDVHAAGADRILPVNRMKPHTAFRGTIESGCTKMIVVGFGKQPGAAQFHSSGARRDARPAARGRRRDARHRPHPRRRGVDRGAVGRRRDGAGADRGRGRRRRPRSRSTDEARDLVAALPFPEIDVLVIEEGGKDISGTTLDPNVTGRFWVNGLADLASPKVAMIVLLGLTPVTAGNVTGIGFVDFVPGVARRADRLGGDVRQLVHGRRLGVRRGRMPMVLPDEESCIRAAMQTCGKPFAAPKRVVRIHSTLHLTHCWVSDALLDELPAGVTVAAS